MIQEEITKKPLDNKKRKLFIKILFLSLVLVIVIFCVYYLLYLASEISFEKESAKKREDMVNELKEKGIRDEEILEAMRKIPRHAFFFKPLRNSAYEDRPIYMSYDWKSQQPYLTAFIAQNLELGKEDKVLIIGIKSGYPLALLAELSGKVYAIERVSKILGKRATIIKRISEVERILDNLGYSNVHINYTDDYSRWKESGPFDGIILNEPVSSIPSILTDQLKQEGRLILPLRKAEDFQDLTLIKKIDDGFETKVLITVSSTTQEKLLDLEKLTPQE